MLEQTQHLLTHYTRKPFKRKPFLLRHETPFTPTQFMYTVNKKSSHRTSHNLIHSQPANNFCALGLLQLN